jgi:hypothetical protein
MRVNGGASGAGLNDGTHLRASQARARSIRLRCRAGRAAHSAIVCRI